MIKSPKYNIPLNVPYLKGNEKIYMNKCIDSNWVSSVGPNVTKFEKAFAKNTNTKYAIACSSGTAALHLALLSLNIGKKDLILVPSLTFVATVNAINYVGASPIIVDIDYRSSHIDCNVLKNFFLKSCTIKNGKCIHKETNKTCPFNLFASLS